MGIDYKALGQRIKKVCKQKRITQEKLAEALEVSPVYVSQIVNGKTKLNLEMLVQIANISETNPCYFLDGVSYKTQNYLVPELDSLLRECPPEKRQLIMEIAKLITKQK